MSSIVNKIKEAVHSDKKPHEQPEGTHGPHSSHVANAADPRVDSDRDHRANPTSGIGSGTHGVTGTHGTTGHGVTGTHGTTGTHGVAGTHTTHNTTAGPHSSDTANKLDPRVDSDRDGSRTLGGNNQYPSTGAGGIGTHTGTHTGAGIGTHTGTHGTAEGVHGPHGSRVANAADPRVDSDRDGSHTIGGNQYSSTGAGGIGTHTGTHTGAGIGTHTGTHGTAEGVHGPHGSRVANAADPRVDSDRDGSHTVGGNQYSSTGAGGIGTHSGTHTGAHSGTHGLGSAPGPAPNTAGPHKSDILNKMDPRVDADLDGSKTIGGNKTYGSHTTRDPTDAAQVPPSVLRQHIGDPSITHSDEGHQRERRHSIKTAQETDRGI